jgi:hypothetical protein
MVSEVKIRAGRSQKAVELPRRRTPAELALYDSENAPEETDDAQTRQRYERSERRIYVTEKIGEFTGLDVFMVDGRAIIFQTLKPKLQELSILHADRMTSQERTKWAKWLREVEGEFRKIEDWLSSGMKFFSQAENMLLLQHFAPDEATKTKMKNRKWDFDSGAWR